MAEGFQVDLSKVEVGETGEVIIKDERLADALKRQRDTSSQSGETLDWGCNNGHC